MTSKKLSFNFKAEIKQLLDLVINSLYKDKDIFLRELISNSSDAVEKLRFESLTNFQLLEKNDIFEIHIKINTTNNTIIISDNGIGMDKKDVINNLGTIAKSGTKDFLEKIKTSVNTKNNNLIGNFGLGFYSTFMVADKIVVESRKAGTPIESGVRWISKGKENFEIENINIKKRGTKIILFIKEEEKLFLDYHKLHDLIIRYSNHVSLPIILDNKKNKIVNKATVIWRLNKQDIKNQDYIEFYKHLTNELEPLTWLHSKLEGKLEYIVLLYIPSKGNFDLFFNKKATGLKLYVKKIFILDKFSHFIPNYLRFIQGVIDIDNLQLNISREFFQNTLMMEQIKTSLTKRILNMLNTLTKNFTKKYDDFWKNFGQIFKEGLSEDFANRENILTLLRFSSTKTFKEKQTVSLNDYIKRMNSDQKNIFYLVSENFKLSTTSPHLELFNKKNIEVLLLSDNIDKWIIQCLFEYKNIKFESVIKNDLTSNNKDININPKYVNMINKMKNFLKEHIKDIRLSDNLIHYPSRIIHDNQNINSDINRLMKFSGESVDNVKYILELNKTHNIIKILNEEKDDKKFLKLTFILLEQAFLLEGKTLKNTKHFIDSFNDFIFYTYKK